jgi:hypothetical protein
VKWLRETSLILLLLIEIHWKFRQNSVDFHAMLIPDHREVQLELLHVAEVSLEVLHRSLPEFICRRVFSLRPEELDVVQPDLEGGKKQVLVSVSQVPSTHL